MNSGARFESAHPRIQQQHWFVEYTTVIMGLRGSFPPSEAFLPGDGADFHALFEKIVDIPAFSPCIQHWREKLGVFHSRTQTRHLHGLELDTPAVPIKFSIGISPLVPKGTQYGTWWFGNLCKLFLISYICQVGAQSLELNIWWVEPLLTFITRQPLPTNLVNLL